jgi:type 1 glutamine amidotransferase
VDVADDTPAALSDGAALKKYQLFVLDYNGPRWGGPAEANFISAVSAGTGVVVIHASNNAFVGWTDYEKLCGLMWVQGTTGHGKYHGFDVAITSTDHPITRGLKPITAHPDELYHKLVNTQNVRFTTLAEALSSTESGGTGNQEPMAIVLEFGKGRVFHTPLGHTWLNDDNSKTSGVDPQFKILLSRGAEWAATGAVTLGTEWKDARPHNTLTEAEKAAGWKLLFDGSTAKGWHGFKSDKFPDQNWTIQDGTLWRRPGSEGKDIVTDGDYADFEFACDWKVNKGGNSGIMYRCTEDHDYAWQTGPEMQILDDGVHADGKKPKTRAGTLYDVVACAFDVARPAGEWNHARIVVKGTHIEHWLNGFKVVDIDTTSETYKTALTESKWTKYPDFNTRPKGRIALQDHGDEVWFRDIKVHDLAGGK